MPLKIVRNDITKMNTGAIVNTANDMPSVGTGCDYAIYKAAGYDTLLEYRTWHQLQRAFHQINLPLPMMDMLKNFVYGMIMKAN